MTGKVFVDLGMSLDGFVAGPNGGPRNPLGDGGTRVHQWVYGLRSWRERLGMEGGETEGDDELIREVFARAGAYVMGRRMFDEGELAWPDPPPFRAPVFVLTSSPRQPWVRQGGTTFNFVTDGVHSALAQARKAAAGKDVQISGGASTVRQFIDAGLVDDLQVHVSAVLLGAGLPLFDGSRTVPFELERVRVMDSPGVTHLAYRLPRSSG
jgi:dihydrofolate reductase